MKKKHIIDTPENKTFMEELRNNLLNLMPH